MAGLSAFQNGKPIQLHSSGAQLLKVLQQLPGSSAFAHHFHSHCGEKKLGRPMYMQWRHVGKKAD